MGKVGNFFGFFRIDPTSARNLSISYLWVNLRLLPFLTAGENTIFERFIAMKRRFGFEKS
jgi:hypothetical protein